jgi:pyridoxamine 5'-phosphate oxidase
MKDNQFTKSLQNMREHYDRGILTEGDLLADPIKQFEKWFKEASESGVNEPNAMTLTTVSNHRPSSRIVLLKGVDDRGFVFYTNYDSRKGAEMEANPWISLNFFWQPLVRQIRIEGHIEKLSPEESDEYFNTRPRESQLGAWASPQSSILKSRTDLEKELERYGKTYENILVPRPPHWGGILVRPVRIEFWQGRENRLHDRFLYEHHNDGWMVFRLAP